MNKTALAFFGSLAIGIATIVYLKPLIADFGYSNGKQLISFYIPLPLTIIFFFIAGFFLESQRRTLMLSIGLFLLLLLPLSDLLLNGYVHNPQDDGYRYNIVASNIAESNTLWGSDDLIFSTNQKVYMIQPGYRYYLAAWIRLFGAENRLYQCVNMFIYLITVISFFNRLRNIPVDSLFKKGFSLFVILSSPFVVKLIMMGLTEWLVVTLFIWTVYSFLHYRLLLTVVLLAMLPFLRQNLLFVSILLFVYIFISQKLGWKYVLIYIVILLLPVYHNVYYANQWKFFATYYNINSFFILEFEGSFATRLLKTFFYHIILYTGIDWLLNNLFANLLAFVCIPIGTLLYIYGIYKARLSERWWYLLITISAIIPTLILGGRAYYPRFELVNLYLAALIFISIKYSESRSIPTVHNARTQSGRMDIR